MSLYDGTDLGRQVKIDSNAQAATISSSVAQTTTPSSWCSSGLKLLQSHMQLKKASATPMAAKSSKERASTTLSAALLDNVRKNVNKPAVIVNQLPFISVSSTAKESLLDEFDTIQDEYNPLYPNDYERVVKRREEEKRKRKDEERRNSDDRRKCRSGRSYNSSDEDEEDDDYYESRRETEKRHAGAAIAPPSSLTRDSSPPPPSMSDDRNSYQPTFGSGSKGLNVAAKIMEKYGYRQGLGLGKSEQGMSTALHVEKTSLRGGKIIHEKDISSKDQLTELQPTTPEDIEPITDVLKNPTKVVLLKNMVGPGEVDEDLEPEIKEEMHKFGDVVSVVIFELPGQPEEEAVRIFVEFPKIDQAIKAVVSLHGRFFAGKSIRAAFYDFDKFKNYDLAE